MQTIQIESVGDNKVGKFAYILYDLENNQIIFKRELESLDPNLCTFLGICHAILTLPEDTKIVTNNIVAINWFTNKNIKFAEGTSENIVAMVVVAMDKVKKQFPLRVVEYKESSYKKTFFTKSESQFINGLSSFIELNATHFVEKGYTMKENIAPWLRILDKIKAKLIDIRYTAELDNKNTTNSNSTI